MTENHRKHQKYQKSPKSPKVPKNPIKIGVPKITFAKIRKHYENSGKKSLEHNTPGEIPY